MTIVSQFEPKVIDEIAKNCGAESMKNAANYLRASHFWSKEKFVCEVFDDVAFFAGTVCRTHFRLSEIAVKTQFQGQGYGKAMMFRIIKLCKANGLKRITLQTNKADGASDFYKKFGGKIVGTNGEDYEMEIRI